MRAGLGARGLGGEGRDARLWGRGDRRRVARGRVRRAATGDRRRVHHRSLRGAGGDVNFELDRGVRSAGREHVAPGAAWRHAFAEFTFGRASPSFPLHPRRHDAGGQRVGHGDCAAIAGGGARVGDVQHVVVRDIAWREERGHVSRAERPRRHGIGHRRRRRRQDQAGCQGAQRSDAEPHEDGHQRLPLRLLRFAFDGEPYLFLARALHAACLFFDLSRWHALSARVSF